MKKLWMLFLLLTCTALVAGSVACGGDDDTAGTNTTAATATDAADETATDEPSDGGDDGGDSEYYNEVADILNDADQETLAISEEYGGPYDDTAEEIDQTITAFELTAEVFESIVGSLDDLEPPADAEDAHNTYMSTLAATNELFAAAASDFEEASTAADVTALQDEYTPLLNTASGDIESNCLVLQELADEAESGADLGCTVQN
jgi:hypothetical protein